MLIAGAGCLALLFLIFAFCFFKDKLYIPTAICGLLELVSMSISATAWAYALKVSGKSDWASLGLQGYTSIAVFCYAMFMIGILCIAWGACGAIRQKMKQNRTFHPEI